MMWSSISYISLIFVGLLANVECRDPINLAIISNPVTSNRTLCVMVDHQTLGQLSPDSNKAEKYLLHQILQVDGCSRISHKEAFNGKILVELSNRCTLQRQMEMAMNAGASGLMILVRDNIMPYPFKMKLQKAANVSFPIIVIRRSVYRHFLNISSPQIDNIPIRISGRKSLPTVTLNLILFHVLAFVCLLMGGYLSVHGLNGIKFAPIFGASQQREETQKLNGIKMTITVLVVIVFTSGSLVLLYFFYDIFVYIAIFFSSIIFAVSLKSQLMEIICRIPMVKDMGHTFVIKNKCLKMFFGPEIDSRSLILFPFCLIPPVLLFVYRKDLDVFWIIQDIIGIFACSYIIKILRFGNLKFITVFCVAFFIYDIFMVYVTPFFKKPVPEPQWHTHISDSLWDRSTRVKRSLGGSVMEDVATGKAGKSGEKIPLVFTFPYMDIYGRIPKIPCLAPPFSILGFGDIIVPGFIIAFAFLVGSRFGRCARYLYPIVVMAGYHIGLILVFVILIAMNTGQPALITLIPCTLIPFVICSAIRGEIKPIWSGNLPLNTPVPLPEVEEEMAIIAE